RCRRLPRTRHPRDRRKQRRKHHQIRLRPGKQHHPGMSQTLLWRDHPVPPQQHHIHGIHRTCPRGRTSYHELGDSMRTSVYMEELDAFTYRERISQDKAVVLIPVGSIEQHGPHMPLNTDVLLSKALAGATAEAIDALVAAPVVYGYKSQQRSGGGNHLPGTTSLDASTMIAIAKTLTLEFARHGARNIAFINGHFENYQFLYEGVDLALRELHQCGIDDVKVVLLSYWDFVDDATIAELYPNGFTGWDLEHGGVLET